MNNTLKTIQTLAKVGRILSKIIFVCCIGVAVADNIYPGIDKLSMGEFSSVGLGVMMIVLSLFCRYGAELNEGKLDV